MAFKDYFSWIRGKQDLTPGEQYRRKFETFLDKISKDPSGESKVERDFFSLYQGALANSLIEGNEEYMKIANQYLGIYLEMVKTNTITVKRINQLQEEAREEIASLRVKRTERIQLLAEQSRDLGKGLEVVVRAEDEQVA